MLRGKDENGGFDCAVLYIASPYLFDHDYTFYMRIYRKKIICWHLCYSGINYVVVVRATNIFLSCWTFHVVCCHVLSINFQWIYHSVCFIHGECHFFFGSQIAWLGDFSTFFHRLLQFVFNVWLSSKTTTTYRLAIRMYLFIWKILNLLFELCLA